MGEHRQGDVSVPADVGTHGVLNERDLALCLLEIALDGPALTGDANQIGQGHARGRVGKVEGPHTRIGQRAPDQKRAPEALPSTAFGSLR